MNINQCMTLIMQVFGSRPSKCLEFKDFYLFNFAKPGEMTGTEFPAVKKSTGEIFLYNVTENPSAFDNAKEVRI